MIVLELETFLKGNVLLILFVILYAVNLEPIGLLLMTPATCNEVYTMYGAVKTLISFALCCLPRLMLCAGDAVL